ncbi:MAG TPA: hypothetical protein VNX21_08200 [Candidatus Thermoplasmatota archaeon]|nr:hypothetical protein [Candidatus Thermoplasmatota archaeon]
MEGDLLLSGPLRLLDQASIQAEPQAFFLDMTEDVRELRMRFPQLTLQRWGERGVATPLVSISDPTSGATTEVLQDVEVTLAHGSHEGWLGIYPAEGARLQMDFEPGATWTASAPQRYGNAEGTHAPPSPGVNEYKLHVGSIHITALGSGRFIYQGPGMLKAHGIDVHVKAANASFDVSTGAARTPDGEPVHTFENTWIFLEFNESTIVLDTSEEAEAALGPGEVGWVGEAWMEPAAGSLQADGKTVALGQGPVKVAGDAYGRLVPVAGPSGPQLSLSLVTPPAGEHSFIGSLRAAPAGSLPLPLLILVAVAAGAGGVAAWTLRRRARGELDPEEMLTLAHLAGEGGRHDEALGWIRRARALAPESGALALEEAFHLGELGLVDEALAAYREAARLLRDGQAELDAALLGLGSGVLSETEAEDLLVTAMERSPALVLELEDHPALGAALRLSPRLAAAMRAAHRRLGDA